jgi:NPCBM-associated, NEW3 domain of alpha-galactosidase
VAYPRAGRGRARSQTRPFKLDRPSNFSRFRIEFGGTAVRLAEVELLTTEKRAAMPLEADVEGGVGEAGSTVQSNVKLANWGDAPLRSELTETVPDRWTVAPTPAPFSPIASGDSQTVTLDVTIPADAELGSYPIEVVATSRRATAKASGNVNVIGDVIEFTPFTPAEEPWLFDAGASQQNGEVYDGHARFADGERYFVYCFPIGDDVTGGSLRLDLQAEYLVQPSTDGATWTTVLGETRRITDGSNRGWQELDVADLAQPGEALNVRIADSFPDDGWGGWLARLRLELQTG